MATYVRVRDGSSPPSSSSFNGPLLEASKTVAPRLMVINDFEKGEVPALDARIDELRKELEKEKGAYEEIERKKQAEYDKIALEFEKKREQ